MIRIDELIAEHCPDGVEFRLLGDCIERNLGGGTPARSRSDYWNGDMPWASVGDITATSLTIDTTRQTITETGLSNSSSNVIPAGWVIVAVKIAPGEMRVLERDIAINQDIRGLQLRQEVDPYYLAYYFQTLNVVGNGTIVRGITNQTLLRISVPVPPLEVQRAIVEVLDTFSRLEAELEAELEARKQQYEHYQNQLLFFGEGEAEWLTLGDIGRVAMCKRIFKDETAPTGEIPFFKIGTFGGKPDAFISRELYDEYRNRFSFPNRGDILLSAAGTIGRAIPYDGEPAYFQDSNIVWLAHNESVVLNRYLRYWYRVVKWTTDGGTIKRLYNENLRKAKIAVPPLEEQHRIVEILDKFDALVNDLSIGLPAELAARRQQYEYYRDKLLTFKELEVAA